MKLKRCLVCQDYIQKRPNVTVMQYHRDKKYCSRACKDKAPRPTRKNGVDKNCAHCRRHFYTPRSDSQRKFCSKHCHYQSNVGKSLPALTRAKMSIAQKKRCSEGRNNLFGDGTKTPEHMKIRESLEYKEWRKKVFTRDGFRCTSCGSTKNIQADHIKSFALHPDQRLDVKNGRTLCKECHKKTDSYLNRWQRR